MRLLGIPVLRAQRNPVGLRVTGEEILREVGPVDGAVASALKIVSAPA